jgi:hypothetical protein
MKYKWLYLSAGLAFCAASNAAAEDAASKDEQKIERSEAETDNEAAKPEGAKRVESRLKTEYKVDDARIQSLRDKGLGYGEIKIALALASKREGGITDKNVDAVMAERNGPPKMGWGKIAKNQGVSLGSLMGKGKSEGRGHSGKGQPKLDKGEHHEKAERNEKAERPERMEKAEKPERADKPEHGKH